MLRNMVVGTLKDAGYENVSAFVNGLEAWNFLHPENGPAPDMGRGAVAVQGVPSGLEGQDYERLITDMIADLRINPTQEEERQLESMAFAMARKAAIPVGRHLSENEMQELVRSLKTCTMPSRTPDGKPVYVVKSDQEIAKWF